MHKEVGLSELQFKSINKILNRKASWNLLTNYEKF